MSLVALRAASNNRGYLVDFKDVAKASIFYLHGSGHMGSGSEADLEKVKNCSFFKLFYAAFKDYYNFFFPQQFTGLSGWENMINGKTSGADFVLEMKSLYNLTKLGVTGHSAGATWETAAYLQDANNLLIDFFIPVAGRGLSYSKVVDLGRKGLKVNAWHGTKDTTSPNHYAAGYQACINWFKNGGGGVPVWNALTDVGHNSPDYAYKSTSGLNVWIDSIYGDETPPPPPEPTSDPVVNSYELNGKLIFKTTGGKTLTVTPDPA